MSDQIDEQIPYGLKEAPHVQGIINEKGEKQEASTGQRNHTRRPLLRKAIDLLRKAGGELLPNDKKVSLEEINEHTVARVINQSLGNPLQEKINGDRYANPFDIVSVIAGLGYIAPSSFADYMEKFPDEYQATRVALWKLHQQGVLDISDQEQSNPHGEIRYYKVVDRDLLGKIAQGSEKPQVK
ncbi:MAG: hypothetical protein COU25_01925 [Candidatus Levybacteria bacterium CG10_big_fil_rev_8_21_14_0_10_35_13]|nr:MAG: hypothetical protein COU25_01925 [Candidatus Levybacteria bacterium CG10_big_fil_rev_8_21_14_0_10_35_13]